MNFKFKDDGSFFIDYERVLLENSFLPVTRLLAANLMKKQYMLCGDFLKELSFNSLDELNDIAADENNSHFEEIILISEMLAAAEGVTVGGIPEVHERLGMFMTWLVMVSLNKKGLIKVYYENISFGEDMRDKIVAEKIKR